MNIIVKSEIIRNEEMTSKELAVYCALQCLAAKKNSIDVYMSYESILYIMSGKIKPTNLERTNILESLESLVDKGFIFGKYIDKKGIILDTAQFSVNGGYFLKLDLSDFQTIMRKGGKPRFEMFRYFCLFLMSRNTNIVINNAKGVVGFMSISYFANYLNTTKNTIIAYNNKLEKLNLIYIKHSAVENITNVYGRYCDKFAVIEYSKEHFTASKSERRKKSHSLGAKLARINNGTARNYTADELQEIWEYASSHNEYEQKMHEMSESYIMNLKDLTKLRELMDNVVAG